MGPSPFQFPTAHGLNMLVRRSLTHPQCADEVDDVEIAIPPHLYECRVVRPAEIDPAKPHEMFWALEWFAENFLLRDSEDAPRAHRRDTFGSRLALVLGIAINDLRTLRRIEVPGVVNGHRGDVPVR